jgi:hypothetical protein
MTNLDAISDDHADSSREKALGGCHQKLMLLENPAASAEFSELIYLLKLGVKTNLRWIGRERPDIDAARKTAARLCDYVDRLEVLIASTTPSCSDQL